MRMKYNVENINDHYHFEVYGSSYIGNPKDHTVIFITKKIKRLVDRLAACHECLVFVDKEVSVPDAFQAEHCIVPCEDAQIAYGRFALDVQRAEREHNKCRKYTLTEEGYYLGENVTIGKNAIIMPRCVIDHDVCIGDDAFIGAGTVIKNAVIGDCFSCQENTVIGTDAFFLADGEQGKFRIPSFGLVKIGSHVDLGSNVVIERGFNSDTILEDEVKIDSSVCIGHDDVLHTRVTVTCGVDIAGLVTVGENTYIGMNATIKQRLTIGKNCMVGMSSSVITNVKDDTSVYGIPARKMQSIL